MFVCVWCVPGTLSGGDCVAVLCVPEGGAAVQNFMHDVWLGVKKTVLKSDTEQGFGV